jgi:hypothetical protein
LLDAPTGISSRYCRDFFVTLTLGLRLAAIPRIRLLRSILRLKCASFYAAFGIGQPNPTSEGSLG